MGTEVEAVCKTWMGNCLTQLISDFLFSQCWKIIDLLLHFFISCQNIEMILYGLLIFTSCGKQWGWGKETRFSITREKTDLYLSWGPLPGVRLCICGMSSYFIPVDQIPKLAQSLWPVGRLDNRQIMDSGEIIWNNLKHEEGLGKISKVKNQSKWRKGF